jgi:hypothetical protein
MRARLFQASVGASISGGSSQADLFPRSKQPSIFNEKNHRLVGDCR